MFRVSLCRRLTDKLRTCSISYLLLSTSNRDTIFSPPQVAGLSTSQSCGPLSASQGFGPLFVALGHALL